MTISRYQNRKVLFNKEEIYKKLLERRGLKQVYHFDTPVFEFNESVGEYPFEFEQYIWKDGDRLYKLANRYYNSTEFWWVIGLVNQKPTDSHYQVGDLVLIPTPLSDVLDFIGFEL